MKNRYILLICAVIFLSGCATPVLPTQASGKSIGKTYGQLVEAKLSDQIITFVPSQWFGTSSSIDGINLGNMQNLSFGCINSCNGQPTRTYTNQTGNKVAVYLYTSSVNNYGYDPFTECWLLEERYELKDSVVVDEWFFFGVGGRHPLYTTNVCNGYDHINVDDTDPSRTEF